MATEGNSGARNLIPAKPGEIRNPKGRPKGIPNSKTRLLRLLELTENLKNPVTGELEGFSVMEQIDMVLIQKARKGELNAIRELLDRLEGKASQGINVEGEITHKYEELTDEELDRALKARQDRLIGTVD